MTERTQIQFLGTFSFPSLDCKFPHPLAFHAQTQRNNYNIASERVKPSYTAQFDAINVFFLEVGGKGRLVGGLRYASVC